MDEIPKAWIGSEVTISYGFHYMSNEDGILESVGNQGVVVRTPGQGDEQIRRWHPMTAISYIRLRQ